MKITLTRNSTCGTVELPAGEYLISLALDTGTLTLAGGGKTLKIPAVRRRRIAKTRTMVVTIMPGGGSSYSLIVSTPKHGEWIAMLEVDSGKLKELKASKER